LEIPLLELSIAKEKAFLSSYPKSKLEVSVFIRDMRSYAQLEGDDSLLCFGNAAAFVEETFRSYDATCRKLMGGEELSSLSFDCVEEHKLSCSFLFYRWHVASNIIH